MKTTNITAVTPSNRTIVAWSDGEKLHFVNMMTKVKATHNAAYVAENMANAARSRAKAKGLKAAYCTPEALEAVKGMDPDQAIKALWTEGWALSAERATKAKAEPANVAITPRSTAAASVTIEVTTQFAQLPAGKVVGWAAKLVFGEHTKIVSGLMTEGATSGKAAIIALTEAIKALKKPCNVTVNYDRSDRQLATIGYSMANGYNTRTGKQSACAAQMMSLRPHWDKHTFAVSEVGSTAELRETAKAEIAKVVPVVASAPIVDTDDDEIEMTL